MRKTLSIVVIIVLLFGGLFAIAGKRNTKKVVKTTEQLHAEKGIPVETASIQLGKIDDTIAVTGGVSALNSVTLSFKIAGRIANVSVREGDVVRKGQVVAQIDSSDAEDILRQALAGLQSAQARLSQARTGATVTAVQSDATIGQAKAALDAAEANLQKIRKGARSQEKMIAENTLATAKANLDNAQSNYKRNKQLFDQGAISAAALDVYKTQRDINIAQYNSAKENLSMVEEGARREDVRAAEMQVAQAKEGLRTAKANSGQNDLRKEDIKAALAGVSQAEAQVEIARQQVSNTRIVSPINGIVAQRTGEPGQVVAVGIPVLQVVDVSTVYFKADVSEKVLAEVKAGQPVRVTVDAYADKSFAGTVKKVFPMAESGTRDFGVRVDIPNLASLLRPGMFARGSVVTKSESSAILVPQDAVEERNGKDVIFTLDGDKAMMHTIKKGLSNPQYIEVLPPSDISLDDLVITSGHDYVDDGTKVYVKNGNSK